MTPEALHSLIAGAETLDVEFKGEETRALSDGDLVEAVVCLANRPGNTPGWLLVGVEDDGHVTGARLRHADRTDPLRLQALIANRTRPSLSARVEIVRLGDEEAARLIQKPEAEARGRLQNLAEAGLVEARGERKGRSWHLSAATYRRPGERAAYVYQRGFEPMQQEQMVLQNVAKHGRITRAEAAGLCKLSPDQAYRLLQRLTESGGLTRHGTKKGAWYERRE